MKLSKKKTDYIVVTAYTGSEWDDVDFALIPVNREIIKGFKKNILTAKKVALKYDSFRSIEFWSHAEYYQCGDDEQLCDIRDVLQALEKEEGRGWSYIEISDEEIEGLCKPESPLALHSLVVYTDSIKFTCFGKHTNEEYWTTDIKIDKL